MVELGEQMTNEAAGYGVVISESITPGIAWRVRTVRHLSGAENHSRHNIFVKVFDANGNRDRNPALRVAWEWRGQRGDEYAKPAQLDKHDGETGHADIPMEKGQIITVSIAGDGYESDSVSGLHAMHPDEEAGNTWGHHSFLVEFKRIGSSIVTPPDPVLPPVDGDLAAQVARNTVNIERLLTWVNSFDGEL